ncbi:MAG: sugar transferase [Oleispira sp.]|nr:sugar transferase [Oleispira sp.]
MWAPPALAHNEQYAVLIKHYAQPDKVKPGITGWAQINGCRGEITDPGLMEKRIQYDLYYIEHWSIWSDSKTIALTPFKGLVHPKAY